MVLEHFRPLAPLRWSPPDNFHITTQFIGDWPEERLGELKSALSGVKQSQAEIAVQVRGFGWFPNPHHPRFLFAGIRAEKPLYDLAAQLREVCVQLGIPAEDRDYTPHLTLARIEPSGYEPIQLTPLRQAIAQLPSDDFGQSKASKFLLYKSESKIYSVIGEFAL